jgi:hypothetical protein
MQRRNFLSYLSALAPAAMMNQPRFLAMPQARAGKPAITVSPEAMKAAWESVTWGGYRGKALTIDVGQPWRLMAWENGQYVPWWQIDEKLYFFSEWLETLGVAHLTITSRFPIRVTATPMLRSRNSAPPASSCIGNTRFAIQPKAPGFSTATPGRRSITPFTPTV